MSIAQSEIEAWVDAYITAQSSGRPVDVEDPNWWAVERFMELDQRDQAEASWIAILGVLARAPSDTVRGVLAAGPLEDLIQYWGPTFIERIEEAARRDAAFRALLSCVWQSGTPEVWDRVTAFRR